MADDFQWFWSSETGRDNILRDELADLQAESARASARASAQSSRLNSRLAQLQGSIESRLTALSAAFDAYVELGDVREQLAGYPDTMAVRRDAAVALDLLTRGGTVGQLETRGLDYWLPHAMNALAALVQGDGDPEAERRAVDLDRDAELFLVAAAGVLGRGDRMSDRVSDLLVCDGRLTPAQLALWEACCGGVYGPVLPAVRSHWAGSLLAGEAPEVWLGWLREQSGSPRPEDALRWLERETAGLPPLDASDDEPPGEPTDPVTRLRAVVTELVGRGMPGEAELLSRSRRLRAQIENPGNVAASASAAEADNRVSVLTAVRAAYSSSEGGSALRRELLSWIGPLLVPAVAALVLEATETEPVLLAARTVGGNVSVTAAGPAPSMLARARENVEIKNSPPTRKLYVSAILAGVFLLLALLGVLVADSRALVIIGLLGALVAGGVAVATWRQRQAVGVQRAADLATLERTVEETVHRAQQGERDRQQLNADLVRLSETMRLALGAGQAGPGVSVAEPRSST